MPDERPPCTHEATTTETFPDGSALVRCTTCRYMRVLSANRRT